ncbi:hypothetical protein [Halorubrum tebenquichense]|nr:hypothetical protein [Halorubrum tebenquichense]
MSAKTPSSWHPRNKSVSEDNKTYSTSRVDLTNSDKEKSVRSEAVWYQNGNVIPKSWSEVTDEWVQYIEESEDRTIILEEQIDAKRLAIDQIHRFSRDYMKKQYAQIMELERSWSDMNSFNVSMLTVTASYKNEDGSLRPPMDHLDSIKDAWTNLYHQLDNLFRGTEWDYLKLYEPFKSGYAHLHIAVFHEQDMSVSDYEPAINSYLANNEWASKEAHKMVDMDEQKINDTVVEYGECRKCEASEHGRCEDHDNGCVSVRSESDELQSAGAYVGSYISKELNREGSVLDASESLQRFYALMWASNSRRFTKSDSAREKIEEQHIKETDDPRELSVEQLMRKVLGKKIDLDSTFGKYKARKLMAKEAETEEFEVLQDKLYSKLNQEWELLGVVFHSELSDEGIEWSSADDIPDWLVHKCGQSEDAYEESKELEVEWATKVVENDSDAVGGGIDLVAV